MPHAPRLQKTSGVVKCIIAETTDIPAFDGPAGFAAFGHVTEGMDVVKTILAAPVSPTEGDGPMKGQMLQPPVRIVKMERVGQ
jgi:peptidyl-prolyl cis-trans isomerase A (cyclophilin A)